MYEDGQGVGKDSGKAAELFTKAAAQGHEEAKLKIAAENLLKKAEQGDINAQYELGLLYENGKGVSKDSVKAAEWFGKAAEQGNASAQYELGLLYESGQGVSKDSNKAAELFAKAAAQGNGDAKNAIARRKSAKKEKIADTLRIIFRILAPVLAAVSIVLFLSFSYYNRTFQGIFIILLAQIPFLVIYFSGEDRTALRVTFLVINIISNLFITGYFETIVYVLGLAPCIIGMIYHRED
ncbi:MAG: sel1 repeat family protein, partial [Treponema sp.]|nr:sel1 repeat family protein [Treponema sp.]